MAFRPIRGFSLSAALAATASLLLLTSCDNSAPIGPDGLRPLFHISEARFGDGNPDFFFAAPLAQTPQAGDDGFKEGEAHPGLRPYVRICETDGAPGPEGCTEDVTVQITGSSTGLLMTFDADAELYQANWSTKNLDETKDYRIEVWGLEFQEGEREGVLDTDGRWLFGWLDVRDAPSTASCDGTEDFCLINYGQTIPVKVRIQQFVFCPGTRNCAVQFVQSGVDANLRATLPDGSEASSAQLFIPGQQTDFALAFEPCSAEENALVDGAVDLPTFGPCVKTITPPNLPPLTGDPAVVGFCTDLSAADLLPFLASQDQLEHLTLHHFSTAEGTESEPISSVDAWAHATPNCGGPTSGVALAPGSDSGLLRFAQRLGLGDRLAALITPRQLHARAALLDIGGGGQGFELSSFWKLALPAKFEYEVEGDGSQTGVASDEVTLRAKVTDLWGGPVMGATVTWRVISSPGGDAGVVPPESAETGPDGIAQVTVQLSVEEGDNVFHATGRGIADGDTGDAVRSDCTVLGGSTATTSCSGPRDDSFQFGAFDPFIPLNPHLDPELSSSSDSRIGVVTLAADARLPFTVFGCIQGKGTPAVDGELGAGEWDCANKQTFPVNLSGGSVTATLYWMNDDTDLYMAVEVPGSSRNNSLRIEWHGNEGVPSGVTGEGQIFSASRTLGADIWEFFPGDGPMDKFVDDQCAGSSQSSCGQNDAEFGGRMLTEGAFRNDLNGATVYEISHPLDSGDTCNGQTKGPRGCDAFFGSIDLAAGSGDLRGFFLSLHMGSGAQGNTQWPGFLRYFTVEIR